MSGSETHELSEVVKTIRLYFDKKYLLYKFFPLMVGHVQQRRVNTSTN